MFIRYVFIVVLAFLSSCAAVTEVADIDAQFSGELNQQLVVWLLSDIQPESEQEQVFFEKAVADVRNNLPEINMAVLAGDLLKSRSKEKEFEWFLQTRAKASVKNWYEIAGNHDVRTGALFKKYFPQPLFYGVAVGNVLFLLLSDESKASKTEISGESFAWWDKMVRENQDKIIITITHGQLQHSGLLGSFLESRTIADSQRFEKVLEEKRVALWASGHSHLPHGIWATVAQQRRFNNTCFVNVSSIGEHFLKESQSRVIVFEQGGSRMWLRSRNHSRQRFDKSLDYSLVLEKPFLWDGKPPRVLLP